MTMNLNLLRILFSVFLFIFFSNIKEGFSQEPIVNLTPQEQAWLKEHPDIVLAMEGRFPPFSYTDSNDQLVGLTVDIVKLVEERLRYTFTRYENRSWADLYAAAQKREVDVVATMMENPARREWFAFTDTFLKISQVIVIAKSNNEITSKNDLNYRKLAFVTDYGTNPGIMEAVPDAVPVFYDTSLRALLAVSSGEADAFIMGSGAMQYLIAQNNIGNVKVAAYYAHENANQGFGVRKDWGILVTILNKALRSIPEEEIVQLRYKWMPAEFGLKKQQKRDVLTAGERAWLKEHPSIKLGFNPDMEPWVISNLDGIYTGALIELFAALEDVLGIDFEIEIDKWPKIIEKARRKEVDVLMASSPQLADSLEMLQTHSFFNSFISVYARKDRSIKVNKLEDLKGLRVALLKGAKLTADVLDPIREHCTIFEMASGVEAFLMTQQGKADVTLAPNHDTYVLKKYLLEDIETVYSFLDLQVESATAVRADWPELVSIINKGFNAIGMDNIRNIMIKWTDMPETTTGFVLTTRHKVILGFAFAAFLTVTGFVWVVLLRRAVKTKTQQLAEAAGIAEAANMAKSIFLANMSHELRTPLNTILGTGQLMARDINFPEQYKENLAILTRSGENLLDLINEVLEISKINAGQTAPTKSGFSIYKKLDSIDQIFRHQAQEKGLEFSIEYNYEGPEYISTDEKKVQYIINNLVDNAIKYTDQGSVTVRIDHSGDEGSISANTLIIHVEDTGFGIHPEKQKEIFELFYQHSDVKDPRGGVGLGLSLCKHYAELLGGSISVNSEVGIGSVFTVTVPFDPYEEVEPHSSLLLPRVVGLKPGQQDCHILIVEDDKDSRNILRQVLEQARFHVTEATNGQEAVKQFQEQNPDLVLMDIRLPIIDGMEATKRIREFETGVEKENKDQETFHQTPIIALTASAFEEDRRKILAAGCNDFLRKPFVAEDIFDKIAQLLSVEYICEEQEKPSKETSSATIEPADIRKLPQEWRALFQDYARKGKSTELLEMLKEIKADHGQVAETLADMVRSYKFSEIVALVDGEDNNE